MVMAIRARNHEAPKYPWRCKELNSNMSDWNREQVYLKDKLRHGQSSFELTSGD